MGGVTGVAKIPRKLRLYFEISCISGLIGNSVLDCPETSFACGDGEGCVPGYDVCNADVGCRDGSDEEESVD